MFPKGCGSCGQVKIVSRKKREGSPNPTEIYLIIEVADTILKRDREFKATVYAKAGIADYWIVDITNRQLYVFRNPKENQYQSEEILRGDRTISTLAFPDVMISVAEMFGPVH